MITYAALSPHPPLIIPDIGRDSIEDAKLTINGMQKVAEKILEGSPETIIFLTPHGNVFSDAVSCLSAQVLEGDFFNFGSSVSLKGQNDLGLLYELGKLCAEAEIRFVALDEQIARKNRLNSRLDHGILVPLYYLQKAGMENTKIIAISIAYLSLIELYKFGSLITEAAAKVGRKVAIVASGDMSHRLKETGPYGYHPDGPIFDGKIKDYLESQDVMAILKIPAQIRENAGECGYRSIIIMLGALDGYQFDTQTFSYQDTFGVGYLISGLTPGKKGTSYLDKLRQKEDDSVKAIREGESPPVKWARAVLENYVKTGSIPEDPREITGLENSRAGAFVSLKKNGRLRGCIGTIFPVSENLLEEIANNAISAGTRDSRFSPVENDELKDLVYSVDIIGDPQPCKREDLDPKRFGVIVSKGFKKGVLLPDLEGVESVDDQLAIALQKAGIAATDKYTIERFEVKRFT